MKTITQEIVEILQKERMTVNQLMVRLKLEDNKPVHVVINTLKRRDLIDTVGKVKELTRNNEYRPCAIYKLKEDVVVKTKERGGANGSRYRADLSKVKNQDRFRQLLMKRNNLFMLYAKELKLTKDML